VSANLADALDRMAAAVTSMMDSAVPSDEMNPCPMCGLNVAEASEHDPDCGYRIARTRISPADVSEVQRLARVLRYPREELR
jgi:hypothetical protein